jgi:hypothetical protein
VDRDRKEDQEAILEIFREIIKADKEGAKQILEQAEAEAREFSLVFT